jgi:hypothetical protein
VLVPGCAGVDYSCFTVDVFLINCVIFNAASGPAPEESKVTDCMNCKSSFAYVLCDSGINVNSAFLRDAACASYLVFNCLVLAC